MPSVSTDQVGVEPTITSDTEPPDTTQMKVLHEGTGPEVKPDSFIAADYKGQPWEQSGARLPAFFDSFATGDLVVTAVDKMVPGVAQKLPGVRAGSRVLLVVPPKDGYGIKPPPNSQILPNDTLMFVIDVLGTFPADQGPVGATVAAHDAGLPTVTGTTDPKVRIPSGTAAPTKLRQELLVAGTGAKVAAGQWLAVQYTGLVWGSGKTYASTWSNGTGAPVAIRLARAGQKLNDQSAPTSLDGLVEGLVGRAVGSRVLLVVPPGQGYGSRGFPAAGISASDTLVFVVDIIGAFRSGATPTAPPSPATTEQGG